MYYLQNRWKIINRSLLYYGMRKKPNLLKNKLKITAMQISIIQQLPIALSAQEENVLKKLINEKIIVKVEDLKTTPADYNEATFCQTCSANDFIIPGLEFNDQGQCPMCDSVEEVSLLKSVLPVLNVIKPSKNTRFDVAVFYTGGKDSSFLLYYLSKQLNLKVLALTWEIPFASKSSKDSIENAKKNLPNVEFINRKMSDNDLSKIYQKLYLLQNNTCACPSLAYVLFYPEMIAEKIPYFVLGNEPVQMLNLYYNHMAPKFAFNIKNHQTLNVFNNIFRFLTLRFKPLKQGQLQTLLTMKQLAYGDNFFKKLSGYENTLVSNVALSLQETPHLLKPLKKAIRRSSWTGNIPAFIHVDFNDVMGGNYEWSKVKDLITKEVGWVGPPTTDKGLHTSCDIEKCKEYTQFMNFYQMKSTMIPFSAIEISLATRAKHLSREQAIKEMQDHMGFSLIESIGCQPMNSYLNIKKTIK